MVNLTHPGIGITVVPGSAAASTRPMCRALGASGGGSGMTVCIFAGPSLSRVLPEVCDGFEMRGPARQGDVYRAARAGVAMIGLIDGYFEAVPSVWHKEILWALANGIHVYGSASIGALRAVELEPFGMRGVGRIFEAFRDGTLRDDDEVALLHGPPQAGYPPVTEAMVNIRATLDRAVAEAVVNREAADALIAIAKGLFYKERLYRAILSAAADRGLPREVLARLAAWLPQGRIDQKRLDALEMLSAIRTHVASGVSPFVPEFSLHPTAMWEAARLKIESVR
jgi:hypothetical protein